MKKLPEESLNVLVEFPSGSGGEKQATSASATERAAFFTAVLVVDLREEVDTEE